MLTRWQFALLAVLAACILVLVVVNASLFSRNRGEQTEIMTRNQFIQQTLQLESLYQQMVRSLAELSARNNDEQLRALLAAQGITFTVNPPAASAAKPAAKK